ncbi:Lysophospholipase, partial [Rhizoctonia solani]
MAGYTEEWISTEDSMNLYTRRYLPSGEGAPRGKWGVSGTKAAILFVHGFIEHVGRYEHVFPRYSSAGIAILSYDQRGFGRSALDPANRSPSAKYGKTSWAEQHSDIQHMLGVLREGVSNEIPIFLVGHSMGGGLVLSFPTRPPTAPFIPKSETVLGLSGVIATSPLIRQTHPAPAWQVGAGGLVSKLPFGGGINVPAEVKPEDLSRDPAVGAAYKKDPYVKFMGTTKGIYDMINGGKELAEHDVTNWPIDLPLLVVHGTDDKLCSCPAAERFVKEAPAKDKLFVPFEGGYHELQNEIDGIQDKLFQTISSWIDAHLAKAAKFNMSDSTLGSLVTTVAIVVLPLVLRTVITRIARLRHQASHSGQGSVQQKNFRKTSAIMRSTVGLYSLLAVGMWYTSQPDLFTRLRLPVTATGDQIRSALITQRPPEFIPLDLQRAYQQGTQNGLNIRKGIRTSHPLFTPELDRTLQRIETFDIRLIYGRLGHSVVASCEWCITRDDYLLFSAAGLSLGYIALLSIVGVITEAPERRKTRTYAVAAVAFAAGLDVFFTGLTKGSLRKGDRVQYYPYAQLCRLSLHVIIPNLLLVLPHNAPYLTQETFISTLQALSALQHVSTAQQSTIKNTRYAGLVREASLDSWANVTSRKVDAALEDEDFRHTLDRIRPPPPDADHEKPAVERLKDWAGRTAGETLRDLDSIITTGRASSTGGPN